MTDPHLNAQQLFGFSAVQYISCVHEGAGFGGGREQQLSACGSCHWKTPSFSLDGDQHPPLPRRRRDRSSDAAKHNSERHRRSKYNAAHFYALLNCKRRWADGSHCFLLFSYQILSTLGTVAPFPIWVPLRLHSCKSLKFVA